MTKARLKELIIKNKIVALAFTLLLISNIVLVIIVAQRSDTSQTDIQKYPYIDIARSFIPQEHFIVNIQPLRDRINEMANSLPEGTVSVYFEFLNTGANIQVNNESRYYPASLVKLPAAMVAMKKVEDDIWKMDNRLVLFEQDKDDRYGSLYQQPVGTSFTIEQLIQALLTESDNTAHNILMRNMTEDELNVLRDSIGLEDLFDERSEVSAKEYSRLLRALYNSSYLRREGSQRILAWLSETPFSTMLASGLPSDMTFSHKIGEDDQEQNYLDAGIVYLPNRPYLLTVMIKQQNQLDAESTMKQISKAAYEYINGYK